MVIEEIIQKAIELTLPEFLKWLVASGILVKLSKPQLEKVYGIIRNKNNEGKYGFVPNKDEVYTLKKLAEKSIYTDFKRILKNHWGIDVIRTGLYIINLEQKKEIDKVKEIKDQIYKNKKLIGLRLIEMVTEGVIRPILDHLIELKEKQKYCQEDLNNEFEDLIFKWKEITIFIKNEDNIEIIKSRTKEIIDKKTETFFIFAKGKAIETAWAVNVQLQKEKYILEKGYVFFAKMNKETAPYSYYCGFHSSMFLL